MKLSFRKQLTISLVLTVVLQFGCGAADVLKSFRVALASSAPLVNSLVQAGAIPESKATAIIKDFDDGAVCGLQLESEFKVIPSDVSENEKRTRKLNASSKALKCFKAVIDRHNFAAHPKIQNAAGIAEGILASLVVFYSEPGEMRASAERPTVAVQVQSDEKALEKDLKLRVEALKEAMKP